MTALTRRVAATAGVAVALLVYAWWATGLEPLTAGAAAAILVPGVGAMALGQHVRRPTRVGRPVAGLAVWLVLASALAAWELAAYFQHPRSEHPTLSSIANSALDTQAARAAAFIAWLAAAWELARR